MVYFVCKDFCFLRNLFLAGKGAESGTHPSPCKHFRSHGDYLVGLQLEYHTWSEMFALNADNNCNRLSRVPSCLLLVHSDLSVEDVPCILRERS